MDKLLWLLQDQTKLYLFTHMILLTKMVVGYMEINTEILKFGQYQKLYMVLVNILQIKLMLLKKTPISHIKLIISG